MKHIQDEISDEFAKSIESFYLNLAYQCLGRDFCKETDSKRFSFNLYTHLDKKRFVFDGVEIGTIIEDFENRSIEFIPDKQFSHA